MTEEIKDCGRCGEDACLVSFDGKHFVRVRRGSKCKNYRPGQLGRSCQTEIFTTPAQAVGDWNERCGATFIPKPARNVVFKMVGGAC